MPRGLVFALCVLLSSLWLGSGPASADGTATVSGPASVVLYHDCQAVPFQYALTLDSGYQNFYFVIDIAGTPTTSGVGISSDKGDPASGTAYFSVCGSFDDPGTYRVTGVGQEQFLGGSTKPITSAPGTITLLPDATRVSITSKRRPHHRFHIRILTEAVQPGGAYQPAALSSYLEVFRRGTWRRTRIHGTSGDDGRSKAVLRITRTTRVRVVVPGATNGDDAAPSVSNVLRLRYH